MIGLGFPVVDAHMHQWDPKAAVPEDQLLVRSLRRLPVVKDLVALVRPVTGPADTYLPVDYERDISGLDVESVVRVNSAWHGDPVGETRWAAALPFARLGAIVAAADPRSPGFGAELDAHLAASGLVRSVRAMAAHHQDRDLRSWTPDRRLLVNPRFLDGFAALAERGLAFDAWVYSHDLPDVAELARRYPEVTVVLDHAGTPAGVLGPVGANTGRAESERRGMLDAWRDDLAAVAAQPNVIAKISGLTLPVLGHRLPLRGLSVPVAELVERIGPLVRHTLDVFGSNRTMWGSNAPLERQVSSVAGNVAAIAQVVGERGDDALTDVFRATAKRVYAIGADTGGRSA